MFFPGRVIGWLYTPLLEIKSFRESLTKILKGFTYDNDANSPTIPYTWYTKALNVNSFNPLDTSSIILADSNFDRIDTSQTVTAGSSTAVWTNSFIGTWNMLTTDNAVSPAIDLTAFYLDTAQHRVDNPTAARRLGAVLPPIGSTSQVLIIETIATSNTTISFDGGGNNINTTTPGLFNNIIPGRYLNVSGSNTIGNTFNTTGLLVLSVASNGQSINVSGNLTTTSAGDTITIYQYDDFTEEFTTISGGTESKYISNVINLAQPATQMKLIISGCIPSAADFDIYYKTGAATANNIQSVDFKSISWVKFAPPLQIGGAVSSYATIVKSDLRGNYTDITFNISRFTSTGTPLDITPFTAFQIKIVMRSSNAARIPQFKNLRVIAHA